MWFLAGLVAVGLGWWLLASFRDANVSKLAPLLRKAGGVIAFIIAGVLLLRGRIDMALLVAGGGAWLYGRLPFKLPFNLPFQNMGGNMGGATPTSGAASRARSKRIEMTLDHDSGGIDGTVIAGPEAGRGLASFDLAGLLALRAGCLIDDPDGARLLEVYLDSRFPTWGEHAERDADAGRRGGDAGASAAMSEQEAYEILGLAPGAGVDDIRRAHRTLIKRLHPDHGGTTWLAARVNEAKDILLARHR